MDTHKWAKDVWDRENRRQEARINGEMGKSGTVGLDLDTIQSYREGKELYERGQAKPQNTGLSDSKNKNERYKKPLLDRIGDFVLSISATHPGREKRKRDKVYVPAKEDTPSYIIKKGLTNLFNYLDVSLGLRKKLTIKSTIHACAKSFNYTAYGCVIGAAIYVGHNHNQIDSSAIEPTQTTHCVTASALNLRQDPDFSSAIIGIIPGKSGVSALAAFNKDWTLVNVLKLGQGYVSSQYINPTENGRCPS